MTIFCTGTLNSRTIPPRQGRQGFHDKLIAGIFITIFAISVYFSASAKIEFNSFFTISLAAVGILGVIVFIVAEGLSRPPHNGPHQFVMKDEMKGKRDEDERVLVCLGDSLTHGACSANWVDSIVTSLTKLQQYYNDCAEQAPNLLVVNAGHNSVCTHTVLHEKVNHVLACKPDYIFIMIGSNDAMAVYRDDWAREKMSLWHLTERPTEDVLIRNLTDTIQFFLDETTAAIAIATIPPFGEDFESASNKIIHSINARIRMLEHLLLCKLGNDNRLAQRITIIDVNDALWTEIKRHRRDSETIQPIDSFLPYAIVMGLLHCIFGFTWNTLTRLLTGNVVMSEALHLNEDGGNIVKNEVVRWLMNKQTNDRSRASSINT